MRMPGFTAEKSLDESSKPYNRSTAFGFIGLNIAGQLRMSRATGPFGPIGLPGQGCIEACQHICSMIISGGPFFDRCMENCRNRCGELSIRA
jgi:hypothetical protein